MARLTRLYTRKGDTGSTRLGTGREVRKDSPRVEAYGTVDELNARIGDALARGVDPEIAGPLRQIQNELFDLGGSLATPLADEPDFEVPQLGERHVEALEGLIDELNETVGPLDNFILPGGAPGAAAFHVARTVCRRAERRLVTLMRKEDVGEHDLAYLNRLSDLLFVMARCDNQDSDVDEPLWQPGE